MSYWPSGELRCGRRKRWQLREEKISPPDRNSHSTESGAGVACILLLLSTEEALSLHMVQTTCLSCHLQTFERLSLFQPCSIPLSSHFTLFHTLLFVLTAFIVFITHTLSLFLSFYSSIPLSRSPSLHFLSLSSLPLTITPHLTRRDEQATARDLFLRLHLQWHSCSWNSERSLDEGSSRRKKTRSRGYDQWAAGSRFSFFSELNFNLLPIGD